MLHNTLVIFKQHVFRRNVAQGTRRKIAESVAAYLPSAGVCGIRGVRSAMTTVRRE
jgi:hypothetical protein